ncbi:hypothetical protein [Pseudomonas sp. GM79]|nr:hypothetical protein [Pseudomonas sp. GM79]
MTFTPECVLISVCVWVDITVGSMPCSIVLSKARAMLIMSRSTRSHA